MAIIRNFCPSFTPSDPNNTTVTIEYEIEWGADEAGFDFTESIWLWSHDRGNGTFIARDIGQYDILTITAPEGGGTTQRSRSHTFTNTHLNEDRGGRDEFYIRLWLSPVVRSVTATSNQVNINI